jgi:hypothetical protein
VPSSPLNTTRCLTHISTARPDVFSGVGQLTQAVLADPLAHDIRTLAAINQAAASGAHGRRLIPYILIEPTERDRIGEIARRVAAEHYSGLSALRGSVGALSQMFGAGEHRAKGELLSSTRSPGSLWRDERRSARWLNTRTRAALTVAVTTPPRPLRRAAQLAASRSTRTLGEASGGVPAAAALT